MSIWRTSAKSARIFCINFLNSKIVYRTAIHLEDCLKKTEDLSECLVNWLEVELSERCVIVVDGKTIRGSQNKEHKAYHIVSAFVADNRITLGEVMVDESSTSDSM